MADTPIELVVDNTKEEEVTLEDLEDIMDSAESDSGYPFNIDRCHIVKDEALRKLWADSENEEAFGASSFFLMLDCASNLASDGFDPIEMMEALLEQMKYAVDGDDGNDKPTLTLV